jgi:hypothetical protein
MKVPGCRIVFACLVIGAFLAWPVYANPIPPDMMSIVHIEKDGTPYNYSINFSLNCYGHSNINVNKSRYDLQNKTAIDPNSLQLVFSLSSTKSPYYGSPCDLCYPGFNYNRPPYNSELCQLNGTTEKGAFSVWNSSDKPVVNYSRSEEYPYNIYEFYFTLPSDNQTREFKTSPMVTSSNLRSPVESLYCTLQQFFGGRCE